MDLRAPTTTSGWVLAGATRPEGPHPHVARPLSRLTLAPVPPASARRPASRQTLSPPLAPLLPPTSSHARQVYDGATINSPLIATTTAARRPSSSPPAPTSSSSSTYAPAPQQRAVPRGSAQTPRPRLPPLADGRPFCFHNPAVTTVSPLPDVTTPRRHDRYASCRRHNPAVTTVTPPPDGRPLQLRRLPRRVHVRSRVLWPRDRLRHVWQHVSLQLVSLVASVPPYPRLHRQLCL